MKKTNLNVAKQNKRKSAGKSPAKKSVKSTAKKAVKPVPKKPAPKKPSTKKVVYRKSTDKVGDILVNQAGVKYKITGERYAPPAGYDDGKLKIRILMRDMRRQSDMMTVN